MPKLSGSAHGTLTKFFRELSRTYIHNTAVQEQRQRIRTIAQVMPYLHRILNSLIIRAVALVKTSLIWGYIFAHAFSVEWFIGPGTQIACVNLYQPVLIHRLIIILDMWQVD